MRNFMFGLSEIGGQVSETIKTDNGTKPKEQIEPSNDEESKDEDLNLKNLFLSFDRFIPYLTLFKLPIYFN